MKARLALEFALEIELGIEVVAPGLVERTLDQRQARGWRGGKVGTELVRLLHQRGVVVDLPDQAPGLGGLGRQRLGEQGQRPRAGGTDEARKCPGAARI